MTRTDRTLIAAQRLTAAGAALAVTMALLSTMVGLADGYRADELQARDAMPAQQAASQPAAQQVVVTGRRAAKA